MSKKYIISIGQGQSYPFDGPKLHCNEITVRKTISLAKESKEESIYTKVHLLLALTSPFVIQIKRVLQIKNRAFVIDYEYVPENMVKSQKSTENAFISTLKDKLNQLFLSLSELCIKAQIKIDDIGLNQQGQPKIHINHNFEIVSASEKSNLIMEYQVHLQKLFEQNFSFRISLRTPSELSDYSSRLDKKISQIQDKINRRKLGKSKSSRGSARSNDSNQNTVKKQNNIVLQSLSSKNSNNSVTSGVTCYSYIDTQQNTKPRIHKSSFNDFTTTSHKLNQSTSREDSLKRRLNTALEKSKQTFKVYQKYIKRGKRL